MTLNGSGRKIPGLHGAMPVEAAARLAIDARLKAVAAALHEAASSSWEEPKPVRGLRVASRRAEAVLLVFEPMLKASRAQRAAKRIAKLRRAAAAARTADVHARLIRDRLEASEGAEADALRVLLAELAKESVAERNPIRELDQTRVADRLRADAERLAGSLLAEELTAAAPTLSAWSKRIAGELVATCRDVETEALRDIERAHDLRRDVRRLRYAAELFGTPTGKPPQGVRDLQRRLGRLNDLHELHLRLSAPSTRERVGDALVSLTDRVGEELAEAHNDLLTVWRTGAPQDSFDTLLDVLDDAEPSVTESPSPTAEQASLSFAEPARIAAIDVGTNSIRLMVAQVEPDGQCRLLDDEKENTRLGKGMHGTGVIRPEAIEVTARTIAHMCEIARGYNVSQLRVIGTSAAREAKNRDELIARVRDAAGVDIEVISATREAQLSFSSAAHAYDLSGAPAVVVDIGGGSTEVVLAVNGVIDRVYTIALGAVRLTDMFGGPIDAAKGRFEEMLDAIAERLGREIDDPPFDPAMMIGAGGTFTTLATISALSEMDPATHKLFDGAVHGHEITRSRVRHLIDEVRAASLSARPKIPGLSADRADIILAGLVLVDQLMVRLNVNRLYAHDGGVRDGLLREMAHAMVGTSDAGQRDPMVSVRKFAETCRYEKMHSEHVAKLSLTLFDALVPIFGDRFPELFTPSSRMLLEAAGVLHDIGYLVNYTKHHKHSYHLIVHSAIAGLTRRETEIIANVARYHRRAEPNLGHPNLARLNAADRELVSGLSAILRVADGLDRSHRQQVGRVDVAEHTERIELVVHSQEDPSVNIWGAERKAGLFERVFGRPCSFRWAAEAP